MENKAGLSGRDIISVRVLKAPRGLVFNAWTDPEHLSKWWGPKGFRNTFHEFDLKSGGVWAFTMHGPDGTDYENKSIFVEIQPTDRIVFDHVSGHRFRVTATFESEGENTKLTFHMCFDSEEECQKVKAFVVPANEENFDRLEAELIRMGK